MSEKVSIAGCIKNHSLNSFLSHIIFVLLGRACRSSCNKAEIKKGIKIETKNIKKY